jgi:hypothetical protein
VVKEYSISLHYPLTSFEFRVEVQTNGLAYLAQRAIDLTNKGKGKNNEDDEWTK